MKPADHAPGDVDAYIAQFPPDVQRKLQNLRETIQAAAPGATEAIKYQMPTFVLEGNLVHFAVHTHHIGFYPTPSAIEHFQAELSSYVCSKGAVQFPDDRPIPLPLIKKIVKFRVAENLARAAQKQQTKKPASKSNAAQPTPAKGTRLGGRNRRS